MAAVVVTAQNIRLDDAEAVGTVWADIGGGPALVINPDFPYQSSNCISRRGFTGQRGIALNDNVTSDISGAGTYNTVIFKFLCTTPKLILTKANLGLGARIGSSSGNYHQYKIHGNDTYPSTQSWLIVPIDPNIAGYRDSTTGTPVLTAADFYAITAEVSVQSQADNYAIDAVDIGAGLTLVGGDGATPDAVWQDFLDFDDGTAANRFGYITALEGVLFLVGKMIVGSATATEFTDSDITIIFPDGLYAAGFAGIDFGLQSASSVLSMTACSFIGRGSSGGSADTRPDYTVTGTSGSLTLTGCSFRVFRNMVLTSAATLTDCILADGLNVAQNGATIDGCTISGATTADGVGFLVSDDLDLIKNNDFTASDGHAIEYNGTPTASYTLDGNSFTGYGADGTTDAAIFNSNTSGTLTITVVNGSLPTVRTASGGTTIITAAVTLTVTVKDVAGAAIQDAQTAIFDSSDVQLMNEDTTAGGIATESYTGGTPENVTVRVRKGSTGATKYFPVSSPQTITSSGLDVTITMVEDTTNSS